MLLHNHLLAGVFVFTALSRYRNEALIAGFIAALIGAVAPDFDIGFEKARIRFLKHRGFTHTGFALLLSSIVVLILYGYVITSYYAIGYASHLFLDSLTRTGIPVLNPVIDSRFKGPIRTGSLAEIPISLLLITGSYILF